MDVDTDLGVKLAAIAETPNQRDRIEAYLSLLESLLSSPDVSDLTAFGRHFTTSTSVPLVAGRRVLGAFVAALTSGLMHDAEDEAKWTTLGAVFAKHEGSRKAIIEGVLGDYAGWCEEQTTRLRRAQSAILQNEEDWAGAADALIRIPLEGGSRLVGDDEKLGIYLQIVRLLLEDERSERAQHYFNRASLLITPETSQEAQLTLRLSQARLFDFSARFTEAARVYHDVSLDAAVDEDDRLMMLQQAVTTSILAPAGPQRLRLLAQLNRDDRVHSAIPAHLGTMLRKMLLEYIVRPAEVAEFEAGLMRHQKAQVEGGGTVLERAVREHNVGACAKVYDNISFDALGDLLGLDAPAAETVARKMIEQGRLRAWIDQPLGLLYFESRHEDKDGQVAGTAGGLGVEREETPIEPVAWTERWDARIRHTSIQVETIAAAIQSRGLVQ
ncbi:hypothetical protein CC85DRAFT_265478 [Cutaneotrichosporon oleaginosum]|uniref:COP9 signalosome complex subunit 4 n=1 Tax=Cutaneotrichosporon oleaginosum TaxID=879819 RepID=A0A0J0XE94_9TREE|nr:uncharacterized protein CC85DRAFT_265478 [Cutaneotrichosporon oleaginosum]KLT39383.1 hypothetical protein CC85DRAFT_265478 [Cutaneotrichosporon oleaginosum]